MWEIEDSVNSVYKRAGETKADPSFLPLASNWQFNYRVLHVLLDYYIVGEGDAGLIFLDKGKV